MKKLIFALAILLFSSALFAQIPTKCFKIESILVDACSNPEGENEMVRFKVGPTSLNANNLNVAWPTASNPWLGNCQNATTANLVTALNATIQGCGRVVEPIGGILPPGAQVILLTSTNLQVLANSFANLNDTIYAVFQCSGNTAGHFGNSGTGLRTLIMSFNPPSGCGDTVVYDRALLVNINSTTGGSSALQEGSSVNYSWNGTPSYYNNGCVAPIIELLISINGDSCANTAKTFSLSSNTNVNNIIWSFGDPASGANNSANTLVANHTFSAPGTFSVTATISGSCGTYTKDTTITVVSCGVICNPTAQVAAVGNCVENAVSFTATADSAIASVSWNFGDPTSVNNSATGLTASHLFTATGAYTITATVTTVCGTVTTATAIVNVITCTIPCNPTAQVAAVSNCVENAVSFTATADSAIASVSWNFGDPTSANNTATGLTASHLFTAPGAYTITATVTTVCGTVTTATTIVNVITCTIPCNPTAQVAAVGNCVENAVSFTATADSAIASVSWNFGDPTSANNTATGLTASHLFTATGAYTITATVTTVCGTVTTATTIVNVITCTIPNPICEASISSNISCLDLPTSFTVAADSTIIDVNWNFDDPNSTSNTATGALTAHSFSAPGVYNVTAIVELSCGLDTVSRTVQIDTCVVPPSNLCPTFAIPNAFTPNGDGKNDVFQVLNAYEFTSLELHIFNRWGELVFSGNGFSAWDGTFKGQSQPIAVYVYTATGVCPNGKKVGANGSVTLLR